MSVTRAKFALMQGVTPTRVGQWIKEGKINGGAISGSGRSATIVPDVARRQLAKRLDPGQMLGNGRKTTLRQSDDGITSNVIARLDFALAVERSLKNPSTDPDDLAAAAGNLPRAAVKQISVAVRQVLSQRTGPA